MSAIRRLTKALAVAGCILISFASWCALPPSSDCILNDSRVKVTRAIVRASTPYVLKGEKYGSVWVSLNSEMSFVPGESSKEKSKTIQIGEAGLVRPGTSVQFRAVGNPAGVLIVVEPKTTHQPLTITSLSLDTELEDASDSNETLLIAISACRLQDTRNTGDESEWIPSRPEIISLKAGHMRWLRAGTHHLENLGSDKSKLVEIEW